MQTAQQFPELIKQRSELRAGVREGAAVRSGAYPGVRAWVLCGSFAEGWAAHVYGEAS